MQEQLISFETAKLAKEKGFDLESLYFYAKPNSKMFGIDEQGRTYPIKNTSKKLYKCGESAALNLENVFQAPTQSLLQKWLREVHNIIVLINLFDENREDYYCPITIRRCGNTKIEFPHKTYEEALEVGLKHALTLINNNGRTIN